MSETAPPYQCPHVWMVLPSLNLRLCYDCLKTEALNPQKPVIPLPEPRYAKPH
ncbi:MAG: hypothetical protein PHT88_04660 [Candidatus Moranbacteria bacterium]|nr:hypothetical protein [Candidatus Moranbacteria bacterium]